MEKVFILEINEQGEHNIFAYSTKQKAIDCIIEDLSDRYHFDTDEPYITKEELEHKQAVCANELEINEEWTDGDVEYIINEIEVF